MKFYKPITAGRRKMSGIDYAQVSAAPRQKSLIVSKKKSGGRGSQGKITVRHIGGGSKKKIRILDSQRDKYDIPATVQSIEYDPNRSAFIALLAYKDGEKRYIISPAGVSVGSVLISSQGRLEVKPGNRTKIRNIPVGTEIHDIELFPGKGGQIVKGAGSVATVMASEEEYATLKLPSGELRKVLTDCFATIGQVSNADHIKVRIGKAGRMRWMGIRPTVRGKAMNPVDHPHGGGEGRNPIGLKYPKTPWGKHALGVKTRKPKSSDKFIIKRRK